MTTARTRTRAVPGLGGGRPGQVVVHSAPLVLPIAGPPLPEGAVAVRRGRVIAAGSVQSIDVRYSGAFDIGTISIKAGQTTYKIHVMNEHMAVDDDKGTRHATYPDVITTINAENGLPVSVGHLKVGMNIAIFHIDKKYLPLSSSVTDRSVYPEVEQALGIDLVSYAFA